jgi:hypothetical protein
MFISHIFVGWFISLYNSLSVYMGKGGGTIMLYFHLMTSKPDLAQPLHGLVSWALYVPLMERWQIGNTPTNSVEIEIAVCYSYEFGVLGV